jgi:hypothetical protein
VKATAIITALNPEKKRATLSARSVRGRRGGDRRRGHVRSRRAHDADLPRLADLPADARSATVALAISTACIVVMPKSSRRRMRRGRRVPLAVLTFGHIRATFARRSAIPPDAVQARGGTGGARCR